MALTTLNHVAMPSGSVLQVAQATLLGTVSFTSSSYATTGLDIDFTPKFASSKVLIQTNCSIDTSASGRQIYLTLYRDSTRLDSATVSGAYGFATAYHGGNRMISSGKCMVLDSPNTTSSIHYELYARGANSDSVEIGSQTVASIIICQEIAQ